MQFKVVSALALAITLAAAITLPPPPANTPVPPPANTLLPPPTTTPLPPPANTPPAGTQLPPRADLEMIGPPVSGNPLPTIGASKCSTGHLQCCKSAQSPTASAVTPILGQLGISPDNISGLVGLTCTAIPITGAGSLTCSDQPVCCTDNSFGGEAALGCNLVNLNS